MVAWWWIFGCVSPAPTGGVSLDGVAEIEVLPPKWSWTTMADPGFEAAFPGTPTWQGSSERVDLGAGPVDLSGTAVEVAGGASSYGVAVVQLPPNGPLSGLPLVKSVLEGRAVAMGATLEDQGDWPGFGDGSAARARLDTGRPGGAVLGAGVEDGELWLVRATADRGGDATRFFSSFRRVEVEPRQVKLGGGTVDCPARCGSTEGQVRLAGGHEPIVGLHGGVGLTRFSAMALKIPAGVSVGAAESAVYSFAITRAASVLESTTEEPTGKRMVLQLGPVRTWLRIVRSDSHIVLLNVRAPDGDEPAWVQAFLDSVKTSPEGRPSTAPGQ